MNKKIPSCESIDISDNLHLKKCRVPHDNDDGYNLSYEIYNSRGTDEMTDMNDTEFDALALHSRLVGRMRQYIAGYDFGGVGEYLMRAQILDDIAALERGSEESAK